MENLSQPLHATAAQRVINFYLKDYNVYFDGKCYQSCDEENKNFLFLKRINRIYERNFENLDETIPVDELFEDLAVLYTLSALVKDEKNILFEKSQVLSIYFQTFIKQPDLKQKSQSKIRDIFILKIALRIFLDYQTPLPTLFNLIPLSQQSLKLKVIKFCLLHPNNLEIRREFWEPHLDPQNTSEVLFLLEKSRFKKCINLLRLPPFDLGSLETEYLKKYFFHDLWNHDFLIENPKQMPIKLTYYPFDNSQEMAQHLSRALFFSTKDSVILDFLKDHKMLALFWKPWAELIISFFNREKKFLCNTVKDLNKRNLQSQTILHRLILKHWGETSCLLKFLPNKESSLSKDTAYSKENSLLWLSLVSFYFAVNNVKDQHIQNHLLHLEELNRHPDQEQKRFATYYYFHSALDKNFKNILDILLNQKTPRVPAIFCAHYLAKHSKFVDVFKNICSTFFSCKNKQDRHYHRFFCSWVSQLDSIKKMTETQIFSMLKMLSEAKTRKTLLSALETIEILWNLELFKELTTYHDLHQLLNNIDETILNKFDLESSPQLQENFNVTMKNFRQPKSLLIFYGKIKSWENSEREKIAKEFFHLFLTSIIDGTFNKKRYELDKNPILKTLQKKSPAALLDWKKGDSFEVENLIDILKLNQELPDNITICDSDNPCDLFLSGTEVLHSCQHIYSNIILSCALLGFVWNGNNRILAVLNSETGEIIARAIIRLMTDLNDNKMVLLMEKIHYKCPQEHQESYAILLTNAAIERAKSLKLPLLTIRTEGYGWNADLYIDNLFCPFDFSDASVGNGYPCYDGTIKVNKTQVTCIWPKKE